MNQAHLDQGTRRDATRLNGSLTGDLSVAHFAHAGDTYTVSFEVITPEIAQSYLAYNVRNRRMTSRHLERLQSAMKAGDWTVNGSTIVFDSDGNLSDGQHRLQACVNAKTNLPTFVVRGVAPMIAQDTTDSTRKRTLNSQLEIRGEPNYRVLSAAIALSIQLDTTGEILDKGGSYPNVPEGLRYLAANPGLRVSASRTSAVRKPPVRYPAGLATALHYHSSSFAPDDTEAFWSRLADGSGLSVGDPIFLLRERMIEEAVRNKATGSMTGRYKAAVTIKAWNAWVEGREVKHLRWRSGGASPEQFPRMLRPDGTGEVPA